MSNKPNIKKQLSKIVLTNQDIAEINIEIKEKFNLYFEPGEASILKKIATPNVVYVLKNITSLKFGKDGALSLDSIAGISKEVQKNLERAKIKNPFMLFGLFEKMILIYCIKIEETDDLTDADKFQAIETAMKSIKKLETLNQFKLSEIFPKGYYTLIDLMAKYDPVGSK